MGGVLAIALCPLVCVPSSAATQRDASVVRTPRVNVLHRSPRDAPGYTFIAPKEGSGRHGPEIVDDRGRPVWFHPVPDSATDFRVQRYQGSPVLTWWQGIVPESVDVIADSSYHVVARVRAGNGLQVDGHEFLLTPQGTALITIFHNVPYDLSSLGGSKDGTVIEGVVEELDVATGRMRSTWTTTATSSSLGGTPGRSTRSTGTPARFSGASAESAATSRSGRASRSPGSTTRSQRGQTPSGSSTMKTTESPVAGSWRNRASSGSTSTPPR